MLPGFLSGIFSAVLYLALQFLFGERYLFDDFSFYAQPSLFIIVGTLAGAGIYRYRAVIQGLIKDKSILNAREKSLQEEIKTQADVITELEKRIVTRMSTLITLYEGARKLESIQMDELYKSILGFIVKTLDVQEASLYLKEGGRFVLKESFGFDTGRSPPTILTQGEGVAGYAIAHGRLTTIREFLEESIDVKKHIEPMECLMAAPLKQGEQGELVGALCIHRMPFLNFNSASINLFTFLMAWANRAIGRATYIQNLKTHEIIDPEFGVYSYRYFMTRSEEEIQRSKTYYLPLSLILTRIDGLEGLSIEKKTAILSAIAQLLKENSRAMDVVARYLEKNLPFAVLLLTVSQAQAAEVCEKILKKFTLLELSPQVTLNLGLASFSPQTRDFQMLIDAAKKEIRYGSETAA
jgi:diguanylate cyclase (GGDEF)-like protein